MEICRQFGAPDLFITFTCNPRWTEITQELKRFPNQRDDIVARVFRIKQKRLLDELKNKSLLGRVQADFSVIEFQKCGLPHTHMAITFVSKDKPKTIEDIDRLISTELPDKETDPILYEYVVKFMLHGPCGTVYPNAPCMVNGKCSKHYPKNFCQGTSMTEDGFVLYRRRDDPSKHVTVNGFIFTNQWVVPHTPIMLLSLEGHVNVEKVARPELTKYIHKYMSKGPDRANVLIVDNRTHEQPIVQPTDVSVNEVKEYLDCRYISSIEACWRISEFELQRQYPSVIRLQYHLPDHQWVNFRNEDNIVDVVQRPNVHHTMLTEWFETNRTSIDARAITYVEFPTRWVWNNSSKTWTPRKNHKCIGRLPYAKPTSGERYYLRILLNKVKGAESFDHLKTVDGITHTTFRSACVALGLLEDENEWDLALSEANMWASSVTLRNMFCTMLLFSEITEPFNLWQKLWRSLTDDIQNRLRGGIRSSSMNVNDEELQNIVLLEIEKILNRNGHSLREFPPMPMPSSHAASVSLNTLIREELDYEASIETELFERLHSGLNKEQWQAFNDIVYSYDHKLGGLFFICGSGGTGKTYLWRTLIAMIRSKNEIILSVASSGISALLLPEGRTAHSRFKIPLNPDKNSTCHINYNSDLDGLIVEASMIIWDEAPMMYRFSFEAVDMTLLDILKHVNGFDERRPFGGKLFVLGGDFRHTLSIVTHGRREATVQSTITHSRIWRHCRVLCLTRNMRVFSSNLSNSTRQQLHDFSNWILSKGDGNSPAISVSELGETNWVKIPDDF